MKVTKELINIIAPKHERTSCNDNNTINSSSKITEQTLHGIVIERHKEYGPDCNSCFLLNNVGEDTENVEGFKVTINIDLIVIQPKIKIIQED